MERHTAVNPVLLAIVIAISVIVPSRTVTASQSAQGSVLRAPLHIELLWGGVSYGDPSVQGQGMIYTGEPLVVDIGIINRAENQFGGPVRGAEANWFQRVNVMIYPGDRFEANEAQGVPLPCEAPQPWRAYEVVEAGGEIHLQAGGYQYVRCRVEDTRALLAAGRYSLRAMWSASADPRFTRRQENDHGPSYLTGIFDFEVRDVRTDGERLDLLIHLARHAEAEGRTDDALRLTDEVLRINPNSLPAWRGRERIYRERHACAEANLARARADQIDAAHADTLNLGDAMQRRGIVERWPLPPCR